MGEVFDVSAEGISQLESLRSGLNSAINDITDLCNELASKAEQDSECLVHQEAAVNSIITTTKSVAAESESSFEALANGASKLSEKYQEIIDNNPFA